MNGLTVKGTRNIYRRGAEDAEQKAIFLKKPSANFASLW